MSDQLHRRDLRVLLPPASRRSEALDAVRTATAHPLMRSFPQVAVMAFDHDLRYLSAGGAGLATLGLTPASVVGRTPWDLFSAEIADALEPLYRAALAGQRTERESSHAGRWYSQQFGPVHDDDGVIVAGMGFVQDVTAAHEAGVSLQRSEEQFRVAFENGPLGMAVIGLDGRFLLVNQAMCRFSGYTREQMLGTTVDDLTLTGDDVDESSLKAELLDGTRETYQMEKRHLAPDGRLKWLSKVVSVVRDVDGSPLHLLSQVKDVTDRKEHELVLTDQSRRLLEAQEIGRLGSWELDLVTQGVTWSDSMFDLYGVDRATFAGDYAAALDCIDPLDRAMVDATIAACTADGLDFRIRYRVRRATDGAHRWIDARGRGVDVDGVRVRIVGAVADVTEVTAQVLADAEVRAREGFQEAVMTASPDVIYVYDVASGRTTWTNRPVADLFGYDERDWGAAGHDLLGDLVVPDDRAQLDEALAVVRSSTDGVVTQLHHRLQHADGTLRWCSQRMAPMARDEAGSVTQVVGALRDISDAMALQQRLEHNALHDGLTGLPNRALLVDRLSAALTRAHRDGREVAVLFCDLDGFKRINDTAGHAAGDDVLQQVGARLQGVLRDGDTVARVGGDEFVVVVEPWNRPDADDLHDQPESTADVHARDRALAEHVAERIAEAMAPPVVVHGVEHSVSASIGIAHGGAAGPGQAHMTADEVLQDADAAMYRAKYRGKNRFEVFEHGMRVDIAERGRVESLLRTALADEGPCAPGAPELTAAYQPVFDATTGVLVGFEALARLTDRAGVAVSPELFVSVAEDTGVIGALGTRMLDLACGRLAQWRREQPGMDDVTMAVNVSALQAQNASLAVDVHRVLAAHGLAPSTLVLELTETALLQAAHSTLSTLRSLHAEGVGIAIDDFGTGYASLRYLATLPVSAVKVDRSFTAGLPDDPTSRKIVTAVAGLAADMELACVVEGVETQAQRDALPGGVQLQGYLTGRPQRAELIDVRDLIAHPHAGVPRPRAAVVGA